MRAIYAIYNIVTRNAVVLLLNRIRTAHSITLRLLLEIEFAQLVENRKKKSDEVVCSRDSNWQHGAPLAISILIKLLILFSPASLALPLSLEVTTSSLIANRESSRS